MTDMWGRKTAYGRTRTRILCTLGPRSLQPEVIRGLDERNVHLFRLNLSHTPLDAIRPTVAPLQEQFVARPSEARNALKAQVKAKWQSPELAELRIRAATAYGAFVGERKSALEPQ
jgi:hypothetical protein